jgi:uncharacterized protein YqjF (DUF2071 family)
MRQTWLNLLFVHWPVDPGALRPYVPASLELEEWDGRAWIGITPFRLTGLRPRRLPPVPGVSSFYELNCRTYVRRDGRSGIWFFSLDASSRLAVAGARRAYELPYRHARIDVRDGWFTAERADGSASFAARYRPIGPAAPARPRTLEHFLVERYSLYGGDGELRADIEHAPWPLQAAEAKVHERDVSPVRLTGGPICHYAERQDVIVCPPVPVSHRSPRELPPA